MTTYSNDTINGTPGDDILYGDIDGDLINGDKGGNDRIFGLEGNDDLYGDALRMLNSSRGGNDALIGGAGNDRLFGDGEFMSGNPTGGRDSLTGVDPFAANPGVEEVDELTGGAMRIALIWGMPERSTMWAKETATTLGFLTSVPLKGIRFNSRAVLMIMPWASLAAIPPSHSIKAPLT